MKDIELLRAFGEIDDQFVEEAEQAKAPKKTNIIQLSRRLGTVAAVLAATFIFYLGVRQPGLLTKSKEGTTASDSYGVRMVSDPLTDQVPEEADEGLVLTASPAIYYDDLQQAEEDLGFSITIPESYEESQELTIVSPSDQTLSVIYTNADGKPLLQLTKEASSGISMFSLDSAVNTAASDDQTTTAVVSENVSAESISEPIYYRDDNNLIQSVQWTKDDFIYTLEFTDPVSDETVNSLMQTIQ